MANVQPISVSRSRQGAPLSARFPQDQHRLHRFRLAARAAGAKLKSPCYSWRARSLCPCLRAKGSASIFFPTAPAKCFEEGKTPRETERADAQIDKHISGNDEEDTPDPIAAEEAPENTPSGKTLASDAISDSVKSTMQAQPTIPAPCEQIEMSADNACVGGVQLGSRPGAVFTSGSDVSSVSCRTVLPAAKEVCHVENSSQ